jgi:hypothetical protein
VNSFSRLHEVPDSLSKLPNEGGIVFLDGRDLVTEKFSHIIGCGAARIFSAWMTLASAILQWSGMWRSTVEASW